MQTWVLCWLKEGDKLKGIQRRAIKIMKGLKVFIYEERLKEQNMQRLTKP